MRLMRLSGSISSSTASTASKLAASRCGGSPLPALRSSSTRRPDRPRALRPHDRALLLEEHLSNRYRLRNTDLAIHHDPSANIASAYNQAGADYGAYADGDPTRLFEFSGCHAYADRRIWTLLQRKLSELRAAGARSISILDAGCGPGTWLRRIVTQAHLLGFDQITARGFDVARVQLQRARLLAADVSNIPGDR